MNKILPLIFTTLLLANYSFAAILRVGYKGVVIPGVDYNNLQLAHDASASGDTIQIYTQNTGIGNDAVITKRLFIVGFGYNLDANNNLQAIGINTPSVMGILIFEVGSENSILEGCTIDPAGKLDICTSNITIRRCFIQAAQGNSRLRNDLRQINNTTFESCCIYTLVMQSSAGNSCVGTQIINCILRSYLTFYLSASSGVIINCVAPQVSGILNFNSANFLVKNCILYNNPNPNLNYNTNTIYDNNLIVDAQGSTVLNGSNNKWGQAWADIFDRLGGTTDNPGNMIDASFNENFYKLKAGSPAINGGFDSNNNPTDCGIFGGDAATRYKVGGIPKIPSVYFFSAPSGSAATTNPYNVKVSVRSNN